MTAARPASAWRTAPLRAVALLCTLLLCQCASLPKFSGFPGFGGKKKDKEPPVFNVPAAWSGNGTIVVFMPRMVATAKQKAGDPVYDAWAEALLAYVDTSSMARRVVDAGNALAPVVKISSKTIPSSDYSVLIVGPNNRGVHIQEPWGDVNDFMKAEAWCLARITPGDLPRGCEALRLVVEKADDPLPVLP